MKEAARRSEATKARAAAARTSSASTATTKAKEAARRETEANAAGKEVGAWQKKAAEYGKQEAAIQDKLIRAEQSEATALERKHTAERRRDSASISDYRAAIGDRLDQQGQQLDLVIRAIREPKPELLRILMLSASSAGDLRIGREAKRIRAAIHNALGRDLVQIDVRTAATTEDLLDGLTGFRPHIVHFSGHSNEHFVVFEDDVDQGNEGVDIPADVFARALASVDDAPLLVVMNSCNSAQQAARLVDSIVPFAIGMSEEINDNDAIVYAAKFYAAIADGQSIASSDRIGRVALELSGLPGSDLPTLSWASGSDPTSAWLIQIPKEV